MAQEYDVALKALFQNSAQFALQTLVGGVVVRWLNPELPKVRNKRADLIGETSEGDVVHIEFQSGNVQAMEVRMAAYYVELLERFGRHTRQVLLYVGRDKLRMKSLLKTPAMSFRWISEAWMAIFILRAAPWGDQVLAVLMQLRDQGDAIRQILANIAKLAPKQRGEALDQLLLISGLLGLEVEVEKEIQQMPILMSVLDHKVLGREFKNGLAQGLEKGIKKGRKEGLLKGREEGRSEGEAQLLHRLLVTRFKKLPKWAETRLADGTPNQIENWGERLLTAKTLREVFSEEPASHS